MGIHEGSGEEGREDVMFSGYRQEVASLMALGPLQRYRLVSQAQGKHGSRGDGAPKASEGEWSM